MKILAITQYFPPENVPIPTSIITGLAEQGHEVRVLTGFPNYPAGKVYPGWRQRWRYRERQGLIDVHRVPLYANHSQSAIKRMLNYISFAFSGATARRLSRGADIIYVYATQMTPALGPWLWRITGGRPYVLHIQDLWPDSITGSSIVSGRVERTIARILSLWLRSVYRHAGGVIGIAPTMVSTLVSRGVPRDRAHLVHNWAESAAHGAPTRHETRDASATEVLYAGNVGDMQDLGTAIRAAHAARDAGVVLTILGDGVARSALRALVEDLDVENVRFEDPVPSERMPDIYARADFALISLKDIPVFRGTIPSKFQAALASGIPVITTVQGDVRGIVEDSGSGLTADAEDVRSLEAAFRGATAVGAERWETMSRAARAFYDTNFSKESGIAKIERLLSAAAKGTERER